MGFGANRFEVEDGEVVGQTAERIRKATALWGALLGLFGYPDVRSREDWFSVAGTKQETEKQDFYRSNRECTLAIVYVMLLLNSI